MSAVEWMTSTATGDDPPLQ